MNLRVVSLAAVVLSAFFLGTQTPTVPSIAQESASKETKTEKKATNRVPQYYAQVGLSKEQRDKIYALQNQYNVQIEALQKQIIDLESKRDTEVKAVLTDEQQKKLTELIDAAKKKAAETRGKKTASESGSK